MSHYDPCIQEGFDMFERMTNHHRRELVRARFLYREIKNDDGLLIQLVPFADLHFKYAHGATVATSISQ